MDQRMVVGKWYRFHYKVDGDRTETKNGKLVRITFQKEFIFWVEGNRKMFLKICKFEDMISIKDEKNVWNSPKFD